jgi:hypothetical protein
MTVSILNEELRYFEFERSCLKGKKLEVSPESKSGTLKSRGGCGAVPFLNGACMNAKTRQVLGEQGEYELKITCFAPFYRRGYIWEERPVQGASDYTVRAYPNLVNGQMR